MLELTDETVPCEVDVDALHDALAVLLLRYHGRPVAPHEQTR